MAYFENLTCGCTDCHYNHDNLCYRESIVLDLNGTCENMENCDDYECNDCEFFDFCQKYFKKIFEFQYGQYFYFNIVKFL